MSLRHPVFVLALPCAMAALTGCVATLAPQSPQYSTKFTVENTDRFSALDPATEAAISCTGLQEQTLANGRLEVAVNVKNRDTGPVSVQAQCLFFDDQGGPVDIDPPWQTLSIDVDSTAVVRFTAPNDSAKRYSVRVRKAR
jgi:hypothetical protein